MKFAGALQDFAILRYGIPCIYSTANNPASATNSAPSKPNSYLRYK